MFFSHKLLNKSNQEEKAVDVSSELKGARLNEDPLGPCGLRTHFVRLLNDFMLKFSSKLQPCSISLPFFNKITKKLLQ